jgi:hypothetical protein
MRCQKISESCSGDGRTGMQSICAVIDFLLHFFVKKKVE